MTVMPKGIPFIDTYKRTNRLEVALSLFETCNMHCEFCFQNHHRAFEEITREKVLSCLPKIKSHIEQKISKNDYKIVELRMWGGEAFSDALSDDVLISYVEIVKKVREYAKERPMTVMFLSNGLHEKFDRVKNVLDEIREIPGVISSQIKLSYDPAGRFLTEKQYNGFIQSLDHYIALGPTYLDGLSIVLSKPTIEAYVAGKSILTQDKYRGLHVNVNFYIPNTEWKKYMPTPQDYYDFFKFCVDNKIYNVDVVENVFLGFLPKYRKSIVRACNCKEMIQYNASSGVCSDSCIKSRVYDIPASDFYGKFTDQVTDENQFETEVYLANTKNNCYLCEHFSVCPQFCHMSLLYKNYKADWCPYDKLYNTITEADVANFEKHFEAKH